MIKKSITKRLTFSQIYEKIEYSINPSTIGTQWELVI
jgi:hypothetical protein